MEQLELGLNAATPEEWDKVAKMHSLTPEQLRSIRKPSLQEATDSWDLNKHWDVKAQEYKKHPIKVDTTNEEDVVNNPSHYNTGAIETIDYIVDVLGKHEAAAYCHGNIIKYTGSRLWGKGNPIQDAKKAKWYLDKLITLLEETQGETW